jgi:dTDP-4-amino-4,6-dideoxygalactose transaminase
VLLVIGGAKVAYDVFDKSFRLGTNTLLVLFAAMAVFVVALLADLVVQVTKPGHAVMPASIIVDPTTSDPTGNRTRDTKPSRRHREGESVDDFIVFGRPDIQEIDIDEVVDTLRSGWIGTGPKAARLEERFAEYTEAPYAVATNSCTAAMHLAFVALGFGDGDEVVVPTMTFPATANVVLHAGLTPVLADVDPSTRTIDTDQLEPAITEKTKAVLPVHFAGYPADVEGLRAATNGQPVTIIADAAHAIETRHGGRPVGSLTEIAAFSFYATKNITTAEGGMLTTNDADFADRVRRLGLHGLSADAWSRYSKGAARRYVATEPGYKYNLSDLQAALALHQLARIERSLERRHQIWDRYDEAFADLPFELPRRPEAAGDRSSLHLYAPLLDTEVVPMSRDEFRTELQARGIGTGIHFIAVHLQPYYRDRFGSRPGMFPNSERISERTVSLPMASGLQDMEVERVIDAVRSILSPYN